MSEWILIFWFTSCSASNMNACTSSEITIVRGYGNQKVCLDVAFELVRMNKPLAIKTKCVKAAG